MKKIYYLKTCNTSIRIIKQLKEVDCKEIEIELQENLDNSQKEENINSNDIINEQSTN